MKTTVSKKPVLISFCPFRAGPLLNLLPAVGFFDVFFADHDLFADHVAWVILLSKLKILRILIGFVFTTGIIGGTRGRIAGL
ncbi:hypothetical protein [Candidatus Nitrospira neomarina]|uniref:Uncharacterized protein n=1 Tax=Candidatus Nitrospira neomarina TaxID=3020899 RepID=A0AA96JWN2_9BACT|nr:hypothetical protein [Candidatus Nitrospira neomarina]WNM62997.1 hypothetical protein PQG83_04390 [Candidatus Nitrospira neomarina]